MPVSLFSAGVKAMSGAGFKVESGMQLLSRLCKRKELTIFYPPLFSLIPKFGDIIEIASDDVISTLLIDIISEVLLPTELGGTGLGVLVMITDGNFNTDLLFEVLDKKIRNCSSDKPIEISQKCLTNLLLFDIYDATQFYTAVQNLETIILEHSIGLIVINSICAFYWSEQSFKLTKMTYYIDDLLQRLKIVVNQFKPIIMYTKPNWFGGKDVKEAVKTSDIGNNGEKYIMQVFKHKNTYQVKIVSKELHTNRTFVLKEGNMIKWL